MSTIKVKTTYSVEGPYASTYEEELYCIHDHTSGRTTFYRGDGVVEEMSFGEWESGNDLWDAMNRLWHPFKGGWGESELNDGVEFFVDDPWDNGPFLIRVKANHGCWIAETDGDPGRTTIRENARVYPGRSFAETQKTHYQKKYPWREFMLEKM